ncbi:MAG: hypothetical protein HC882_04435 [Acidobacteria bacterium]|nr:hypothetical protein [Acidobacteriota bacterium]
MSRPSVFPLVVLVGAGAVGSGRAAIVGQLGRSGWSIGAARSLADADLIGEHPAFQEHFVLDAVVDLLHVAPQACSLLRRMYDECDQMIAAGDRFDFQVHFHGELRAQAIRAPLEPTHRLDLARTLGRQVLRAELDLCDVAW